VKFQVVDSASLREEPYDAVRRRRRGLVTPEIEFGFREFKSEFQSEI
jgi:hypothetical protein